MIDQMKQLAMLLLITSCVTHTPFQPVTARAPVDAFERATRALTDQGASIETKDEAAGLIVTKWDESEMMGSIYRYRWDVRILSGTARVDSQCQFRMKDSAMSDGSWKPCGSQREERGLQASAIAEAIQR